MDYIKLKIVLQIFVFWFVSCTTEMLNLFFVNPKWESDRIRTEHMSGTVQVLRQSQRGKTEMVWICADEGYRKLSWIKWRRTSRGLVWQRRILEIRRDGGSWSAVASKGSSWKKKKSYFWLNIHISCGTPQTCCCFPMWQVLWNILETTVLVCMWHCSYSLKTGEDWQ